MGFTKNIPAVILGSLIALVLTFMLQGIVTHIFPLPPGTDMYDADSAAKAFAIMPRSGLYMMLVNYCFTSFVGGILSTLISKREKRNPALVVGIILSVGSVWNYFLLHEPLWFFALALLTYIPFTYFGYLIARK
jgi:hypothetical protein